jgi:hypothetical protein
MVDTGPALGTKRGAKRKERPLCTHYVLAQGQGRAGRKESSQGQTPVGHWLATLHLSEFRTRLLA